MLNLDDIHRVVPGVADFSDQELTVLLKFTLLWTLFEAQVLDTSASAQKIADYVHGLTPALLEGDWFQEHLEYFKNRYIDNDKTNYRFERLVLRRNDKPSLVRAVLIGENQELSSQLITCLVIVYRFRNNFFHGKKWMYSIQDQYDNFSHAIYLLTKCMERFPHNQTHQNDA